MTLRAVLFPLCLSPQSGCRATLLSLRAGEREGGEREREPTLSQALSTYQKNLIPFSSQPYEKKIITPFES